MARYGHPSKDAARQRLMGAFELGARGDSAHSPDGDSWMTRATSGGSPRSD
jgi:hypothetical protein